MAAITGSYSYTEKKNVKKTNKQLTQLIQEQQFRMFTFSLPAGDSRHA